MASTRVSRASSICRAAASRVSKAATMSAPTWVSTRVFSRFEISSSAARLLHDGHVGKAEALKFPVKTDLRVASRPEIAEKRVRPASQPTPGVRHEHARDERAEYRLLAPHDRCRYQGLTRSPAPGGFAGPGGPDHRAGRHRGSGG